jgi:hypothetical protein
VRQYLMILRTLIEGRLEQTRQLLDEVAPHHSNPESVYYIARTYARLGEVDRALAELARSIPRRPNARRSRRTRPLTALRTAASTASYRPPTSRARRHIYRLRVTSFESAPACCA